MKKLQPGFRGLSRALMHKNEETHQHSSRVAFMTRKLGESCGFEKNELTALQMAACLHDIGKIGIPDSVLCKPDIFDDNDWKLMCKHPERGEDIILSLELNHCSRIARAVRHHHENFDGSGYPDKLKGEDICHLARVVSVVDSYDAMTFSRPHQSKKTHTETMQILFEEEGIKSDPYIFRKFVTFIQQSELRAH